MLSIDLKEKALIGNFDLEGHTHIQTKIRMPDHDFFNVGRGKLISHGLYELARSEGYVHLNTSPDTSELYFDSSALAYAAWQ